MVRDERRKERSIPRAPRPYLVSPPSNLQVHTRIYQGVDTRVNQGELFAASPYTALPHIQRVCVFGAYAENSVWVGR